MSYDTFIRFVKQLQSTKASWEIRLSDRCQHPEESTLIVCISILFFFQTVVINVNKEIYGYTLCKWHIHMCFVSFSLFYVFKSK